MTDLLRPAPSSAAPPRFAVWSDNVLAAEELAERLRELGQSAVRVSADTPAPAECLVAAVHKRQLSTEDLAAWTRLANHVAFDIVARPPDQRGFPPTWPCGSSIPWTGRVADLGQVARTVVDLLWPASLHYTSIPILFPTDRTLPGVQVMDTRQRLAQRLTEDSGLRIIPVLRALYAELNQPRPAATRLDYDLSRLLRWSSDPNRSAFLNARIGRPNELSSSLSRPRTLDLVIRDPRTSRLVLLLGEPGVGKTLQLRHFDANSALRSIRVDGAWRVDSFYVALSEQPAQPRISVDWLSQRWRAVADVQRWCTFDQFLADGGTVLLDGLNEGGMRALPLEQWMLQWRDVLQELLERGVGRVVVSCRTRDQLIPLSKSGGEPVTAVTVLPLGKREVVAVATQIDPNAARRLDLAMDRDPGLADLYSNPFRLRAYLESGTAGVASTGARLFGLQIAAAILREREHLNFHDRLIPERTALALVGTTAALDSDPWPILGNMPLMGGLATLAKQLSFPTPPQGNARLTMPRNEAAQALATALHAITDNLIDADLALDTAKDLHILVEERSKIRFAHPTLLHLFAAFGCTAEDIVALAEDERRFRGQSVAPQDPLLMTGTMIAPSYADYRYDEVYQFAAQFRGVEVPDRLVGVDPVLAARVYLTVQSDLGSPAATEIIKTLRNKLDEVVGHRERGAMIAALGDLGWRPPGPRTGGARALAQIPAAEWHLGLRASDARSARGVTSEYRLIELPSFRISRFPVSNAEFGVFIEHGGYDDKTFWTPEGWEWRIRSRAVEQFVADWGRRQEILRRDPGRIVGLLRSRRASPTGAAALVRFANLEESEIAEHARRIQARPMSAPRYWERKPLKNPLQPVVGVSWFEANAFCEWLSRELDAVVRLASEDEWEAACLHSLDLRDTAAVDEVLGGPFANTSDLGYPATTPIGAFATPEHYRRGLPVDLLGNVFEWVFDYYAPGDHNRRTVKGGSWRHEVWRAHPAYRGRGDVDIQNDDIGFRYVVAED